MSPLEAALLRRGRGYVTRSVRPGELTGLIHRLHPLMGEGMALRRLGPAGDGGYLVPDDLDGIDACFSPGVAMQSGFELDCAEMGMQVFMADPRVAAPAISHERFHFTRSAIGAVTNSSCLTLDDWFAASRLGRDAELLLQMDIEGGEYESLLSVSSAFLRQSRILVVEFHDLEQLWNGPFFQLASRLFEKVLQTHACVHLHPNNASFIAGRGGIPVPSVMEFTFLRRDRLQRPSYVDNFPHPLDEDNLPGRPGMRLPKNWYRPAGDKPPSRWVPPAIDGLARS